jgi:hypothetical protein
MCFTFSLKNDGFQLCLQENNSLITSMVIIATTITNEEMPDKRPVGLVHAYYVSSNI